MSDRMLTGLIAAVVLMAGIGLGRLTRPGPELPAVVVTTSECDLTEQEWRWLGERWREYGDFSIDLEAQWPKGRRERQKP